MKHTSTRTVFEYWNDRRGTRPAPERGEIDPAPIRYALGDTIMLAADFVDQLRFRLAGTRVCALFTREIKGEAFTALWAEASAKRIEHLLGILQNEATGSVAGVTARTAEGDTADLELLLLPLAYSGHARIRALGVLAPIVPPYWLGERPAVELELGTVRHIGQGIEMVEAPRLAPLPPAEPQQSPAPLPERARVKHGFIVYRGGRETPPGERSA